MAGISSNWQKLLAKKSGVPTAAKDNITGKKRSRPQSEKAKTDAKLAAHAQAPAATQHKAVAKPAAAAPKSTLPGNLTTYLAMDCEMVGVGENGVRSALARCSIVNFNGEVVYDKHVKSVETVTDFRTAVSGILPSHITGPSAVDFKACQTEVAALVKDRIIIGHSLSNDLQSLLLSHPRHMIRDTARCKLLCPFRPRALRVLVQEKLSMTIHEGHHDSVGLVEDARCVLALYKLVRKEWEKQLAQTHRVIQSKKAIAVKKELKQHAPTAAAENSDEDSAAHTDAPMVEKKTASSGAAASSGARARTLETSGAAVGAGAGIATAADGAKKVPSAKRQRQRKRRRLEKKQSRKASSSSAGGAGSGGEGSGSGADD